MDSNTSNTTSMHFSSVSEGSTRSHIEVSADDKPVSDTSDETGTSGAVDNTVIIQAGGDLSMTSRASAPEQATYSIGVAARMTGLSVHTLRMWERRYQLLPVRRTGGGQRAYTLTDIDHLKLLKQLTDRGVRIGDIAKLPSNQLMNLLIDSGENTKPSQHAVVKIAVADDETMHLCRQIMRQFPHCEFSRATIDIDHLEAFNPPQGAIVAVTIAALSKQSARDIKALSQRCKAVLVGAAYVNPAAREVLRDTPTLLFTANEAGALAAVLRKIQQRDDRVISLDSWIQAGELTLPASHPRYFSDSELRMYEQRSDMLNCECPPHIVNLIRQLNAFEEYSLACEIENAEQASLHACIYAYSSKARHLMEKALLAIQNGH